MAILASNIFQHLVRCALLVATLLTSEGFAHPHDEEAADTEIEFSTLIEESTDFRVLAFDHASDDHGEIVSILSVVCEQVRLELSQPDHPCHDARRINEVSRFFEDCLMAHLDAAPRLVCSFASDGSNRVRRSGYPDLKLTDLKTGNVFYLDPKIHHEDSLDDAFRTFYYTPRSEFSKIQDNAIHLVLGFSHTGKVEGRWRFSSWRIVDLHTLPVRLKREYSSSNKHLYTEDRTISRSRSTTP